jgi:hypothetical protein
MDTDHLGGPGDQRGHQTFPFPFPGAKSPQGLSVNNTGAGTSYLSLPRRTLTMVLQRIADAVQAYTGLSLATAATILALMLATYLLVSSLFVAPVSSSSAPPEPPHQDKNEEEKDKEQEEEATVSFVFPDPVEVGEVTLEQLRAYDGKDPAKQILIAIRSQVYDVSRGR